MRVWNSLDEVPTDLPRTVVTLGNFDGDIDEVRLSRHLRE